MLIRSTLVLGRAKKVVPVTYEGYDYEKKWKSIVVIVVTLIVGLFAGAFIQLKIDSKHDDEIASQLQDATVGVLLYSVGYNNITKAIVEFADA
jgi:uncharacterized protein YneF (UPF0154 family)